MGRNSFRDVQYAFAAHLRNPEMHPVPGGIEERRMAIYRDLFFNNIRSLLAATFPVLHEILGAVRWKTLVRAFYHEHVSRTPHFPEVPQEFLAWLVNEFENDGSWPAFMQELAHYEWVELAVSSDPREYNDEDPDPEGNLLEGVPVLSPVAWPLAYRFPVHRLSPDFQPEVAGEPTTFLVVHRNRDDAVGFTEINAVTARLLELLQQDNNETGREIMSRIATEIGHSNPQAVIDGGLEILGNLKRQDIVPGTRRPVDG